MSWTTFHNRGDVLRDVMATADERRDGVLPTDVVGVAETFGDDLTLLGALQLRWYTRLSGLVERELMSQPMDLEAAVVAAWHAAAHEMPGTRLVIDAARQSTDPAIAVPMSKGAAKEHQLLATMAGKGGPQDVGSQFVGAQIEARARETLPPLPVERPETGRGFLDRLKAVLAA